MVLVARKGPRIKEALQLDLAPTAMIVSDLAIPFLGDRLIGARVAIVDDVVNVGSTIKRAAEAAAKAGAAEVRAFAISHLERDRPLHGLKVKYVSDEILDETGLALFARRIPEALQTLAKPYDLDFPLLSCRMQPPFDDFDELEAALTDRHGDRVYGLTTAAGRAAGVRRLAIDPSAEEGCHHKLRLYYDETTGRCTLVPMVVAARLEDTPPTWTSGWSRGVWETLAPLAASDTDARARLRLFVDSLEFGLSFLRDHDDMLLGTDAPPYAIEDAQLIFGPAVHHIVPWEGPAEGRRPRAVPSECSPFLAAARQHGLIEEVRERANGSPLESFAACFDVLARLVGAVHATQPPLKWPVPDVPESERLYQRLRIGPTVSDLVAIIDETTDERSPDAARREVTRMLDRFIDAGAVVPTTARYIGTDGEHTYRVYRKGEPPARDPMLERARYAWHANQRPMSVTRATKLMSILAFERPGDDGVQVRAAPRGNTLCLSESVMGRSIEIAQHLRDTGQVARPHAPDDDQDR